MRIPMQVVVHGIKESVGEFEGKAFNSLTFHCEVDLKENGVGRSLIGDSRAHPSHPFKLPSTDAVRPRRRQAQQE